METYNDFLDLSVGTLKDYLNVRGLQTTGKKVEPVVRDHYVHPLVQQPLDSISLSSGTSGRGSMPKSISTLSPKESLDVDVLASLSNNLLF